MLKSCKDYNKRFPHWRWARACEIDAGGQKTTRRLDGPEGFTWIRRALRTKRRVERAAGRQDALYNVMLRDPDMFWAYSIWSEDKNQMRWALEARVLAGETDEAIAEKMGTEVGVVEAYINVFFDVREKLNRPDYIQGVILADAVTRGLSERHYDLLWKMIGLQGGEYALDAAINRGPSVPKPTSADEVGGFLQDFAINTMKYKAALAAVTIPVNSHTQLPLIEAFVKYVEIERTTDNATKAQHSIIDNIGQMLVGLPFKVGTKLDSEGSKMLPFDGQAAELRGDEMMILAAGGTLDASAEEISKLDFPGE
jgi:hypothetical protein